MAQQTVTNTTNQVTLSKVFLKRRRALPFFSRHPWVFATSIERIEGNPPAGAEVAVFSNRGEFVARGLYNPHSKIRVRLYTWDEATPLGEDFWFGRLDRAIALRQFLFPEANHESAYRLVYSEGDGLSGLIVDRYGDWLVVQFTSLALWERREMLVALLGAKCCPAGIWLRSEKGIRESEGVSLTDAPLAGAEPPRPLFIEEHGMRYGVDVVEGQKTGFYLDQRENRAALARYVNGHRVLDLFCYTGGFGLAAAKRGGAREVLGVDVSESALPMARAGAELAGIGVRCRFEKAQAFDVLERLIESGEQFDTVILDPPKLARSRAGLKKAMRGYHSLNRMALDLLGPGGLLVSCSCSGLVDRDRFEEMLAGATLHTGTDRKSARRLQILEIRGQAPDHPVSTDCLESNYLKCYICRVVD